MLSTMDFSLCRRLLLGAASVVALSGSAFAQAEAAPETKLGGCALCHGVELTSGRSSGRILRDFAGLGEDIVFTNEDKHYHAYKLLEGELGQHMQSVLATAWNNPDYKVTEDQACLSCHSGWTKQDPQEKPPATFRDGVDCEACHGGGGENEDGYKFAHTDPKWRTWTPEQKHEKGFVDVRNPIRKAQVCFSCHIGNVAEGKVVTHVMYAAGHPPLPGIELETFASEMPVHWRTVREKGEFKYRDEWLAANFSEGSKPLEDLLQTKSVLISGVVALRETLNLFASQAVEEDSHWPELAVFDCTACHHDLSDPAWRQVRGYGTTVPGRPQFFAWSTALLKVAVQHRAAHSDHDFKTQWNEVHAELESLRRVLDRRPYGIPSEIRTVVLGDPADENDKGLVGWLDDLAQDIFESPVHKEDAVRAIKNLAMVGPDEYPDYNSARQILWAIRSIQLELNTELPKWEPAVDDSEAESKRNLANLVRLEEWRKGPRANALKKIDHHLTELGLSQALQLKLPAGQKIIIAKELPGSLKSIADYDPNYFRMKLWELSKSWQDAKPASE